MAAAAVLAVGAGLQLYGNYQASKAQRKAEAANAAIMREQAKLQEYAAARELDIFSSEADMAVGATINQFAKNGITLSGSALVRLANTQGAISREKSAIKLGAAARATMANMQIAQTEANISAINRIANIQQLGVITRSASAYMTLNETQLLWKKKMALLDQQATTLAASSNAVNGTSALSYGYYGGNY